MGRPPTGTLGTFDAELGNKIKQLRKENEGWGALMILLELEEEFAYPKDSLPSTRSVNRHLKQNGFVKPLEPAGSFPSKPCKKPKSVHELWEMDAQGATEVGGIGFQSTISMKDGLSKKHCTAFPVAVRNRSSQPATAHYKWAFRLAFAESGMPRACRSTRTASSSRTPAARPTRAGCTCG